MKALLSVKELQGIDYLLKYFARFNIFPEYQLLILDEPFILSGDFMEYRNKMGCYSYYSYHLEKFDLEHIQCNFDFDEISKFFKNKVKSYNNDFESILKPFANNPVQLASCLFDKAFIELLDLTCFNELLPVIYNVKSPNNTLSVNEWFLDDSKRYRIIGLTVNSRI